MVKTYGGLYYVRGWRKRGKGKGKGRAEEEEDIPNRRRAGGFFAETLRLGEEKIRRNISIRRYSCKLLAFDRRGHSGEDRRGHLAIPTTTTTSTVDVEQFFITSHLAGPPSESLPGVKVTCKSCRNSGKSLASHFIIGTLVGKSLAIEVSLTEESNRDVFESSTT